MRRIALALAVLPGCHASFGLEDLPSVDASIAPNDPHGPVVYPDAAVPLADAGVGDAASLDASTPDAAPPPPGTICGATGAGLRLCLELEDSFGDGKTIDASTYATVTTVTATSTVLRGSEKAARLEATSLIKVAEDPSLDITGPLSIDMWVSRRSNVTVRQYVLMNPDQYRVTFETNNGIGCSLGGAVASSAEIPANTWTHVACTHDGNRVRVYVNGTVAASVESSGLRGNSNNGTFIGATPADGGHFIGDVDDIHVWARALPASDVCKLAGTC